MIIGIVSVSLFLLISIFDISIKFGKDYGLHNIVFPDLLGGIIEWLEKHAATVTAISIITTLILVYIGRIHKKRDELMQSLKYDSAYFHAIFNEVDKTKEILKGNNSSQICDYVFPQEAYDRMSIDKLITEDPATRTNILDFYDRIKIRNRLYIHRREARHRFIRTKNEEGWTHFIKYVDSQILNEEKYLEGISDFLLESLRSEIKNKDTSLDFEEKPFISRYWIIFKKILTRLKD